MLKNIYTGGVGVGGSSRPCRVCTTWNDRLGGFFVFECCLKKYTFQEFHFSSSYSTKEISFCIPEISATISFFLREWEKCVK